MLELEKRITKEQQEQYREEGYFVLEDVLSIEDLTNLRSEAERFVEQMNAEMDRLETDVLGINHRNNRYFVSGCAAKSNKIRDFVYGEFMAEICRMTLGDTAYHFLDQYVIKAAEKGMSFGWHQDSGYIPFPHKPYLTTWTTLDDVSEKNGTVYLLPYSSAGSRERLEHQKDLATNDMVGYFGDNPGIPIIAPAGSVAVFSSVVFHRSGPNMTDKYRRVFLSQYTSEIILKENSNIPIHGGTPFLKNGAIVASV